MGRTHTASIKAPGGWGNEQPRRAVKGLPRVGWYGVWWGTWWVGVLFGPSKCDRCLVLPDGEEPELITMLSLLALGHHWPWGVPAQDRVK